MAGAADPAQPAAPPTPKSFHLVMSDDFDGTALDASEWGQGYEDPDGSYPRSRRHLSVSGGTLQLRGGISEEGVDIGAGLASRTNLRYGRFEVRFRVTKGAGYGAVVLLWPESEKWPTDGEIDLVEVNKGDRQSAGSYIHNGSDNRERGHRVRADFSDWRVVAVEWLPDRVTYSVDGAPTWEVTDTDLIPSTSRMHLAIQLDKSQGCGTFIDCRNERTPPFVVMEVDYARAYAWL